MSTVIAIANQKGGVGKTTTTIELASCFAQKKKRVLVIDLDQQMNLSSYLGADFSKPSIHEVLNIEGSDAVAFLDAVQRYNNKFDMVRSDRKLADADVEFRSQDDAVLLDLLCHDALKDDYDYIFIDNSPARSTLMNMSYVAADYIVVPTECDEGSIEGINELYADIKLKREKFHSSKAKIIAIVLTKAENTILHQTSLDRILDEASKMEEKPEVYTIRKGISVSECKMQEMPLQEYDKTGNAAKDYRALAAGILKKLEDKK